MDSWRERMALDLEIRGYCPSTVRHYLSMADRFARFLGRSPEEATLEEVNRFQHDFVRRKLSYSIFNQAVCALRFLFTTTLPRPWSIDHIPYQKERRRLPEVLSEAEVATLLEKCRLLKHRAILSTVYACGLRLGEVCRLRVGDIDSGRMVVRVDQGKGRRDRYVMLSTVLLTLLREYWRAHRPRGWLFPSESGDGPVAARTVQHAFGRAKLAAGITKRASVHTLRHSFATHLLEANTNIRVIQTLLGHRCLGTTAIYTHIARNFLEETRSPFDRLPPAVPQHPPT